MCLNEGEWITHQLLFCFNIGHLQNFYFSDVDRQRGLLRLVHLNIKAISFVQLCFCKLEHTDLFYPRTLSGRGHAVKQLNLLFALTNSTDSRWTREWGHRRIEWRPRRPRDSGWWLREGCQQWMTDLTHDRDLPYGHELKNWRSPSLR